METYLKIYDNIVKQPLSATNRDFCCQFKDIIKLHFPKADKKFSSNDITEFVKEVSNISLQDLEEIGNNEEQINEQTQVGLMNTARKTVLIFKECIFLYVWAVIQVCGASQNFGIGKQYVENLQKSNPQFLIRWRNFKDLLLTSRVLPSLPNHSDILFEEATWMVMADELLTDKIMDEDIVTLAEEAFPPLKCRIFSEKKSKCLAVTKDESSFQINTKPILLFRKLVELQSTKIAINDQEYEITMKIFPEECYQFNCKNGSVSHQLQALLDKAPNAQKVVVVLTIKKLNSDNHSFIMHTAATLTVLDKNNEDIDCASNCINSEANNKNFCFLFPRQIFNLFKDHDDYIQLRAKLEARYKQATDDVSIFLLLTQQLYGD